MPIADDICAQPVSGDRPMSASSVAIPQLQFLQFLALHFADALILDDFLRARSFLGSPEIYISYIDMIYI